MRSLLINREQWNNWGILEKCTYVGGVLALPSFLLAVVGLILGLWSLDTSTTTNKVVTNLDSKISDNRGEIVHIVPDDVVFDLDKHSDDRQSKWIAHIKMQARKAPILLIKKAELLSYVLEEHYFSPPDTPFPPNVELTNIDINKISLESISDLAEIELKFEPSFIYVSPQQLAWDLPDLRGEKVGEIQTKLYYIYDGQEVSEIVNMPIRFK